LAAGAMLDWRRDAHFDAEFVGLMGLALADALDLLSMQRIDLASALIPVLRQHRRAGLSLANRRTSRLRREEILPCQSARCDRSAHLGCHYQGSMDLRASPSAAERGTWARPLRRAILARPSPPCTHDDARLRLSAIQSPQKSEMGKKESTDRRLNQACRPSVTPSSRSSLDCRRSDARTGEDGSAQTCSMNNLPK